MSPRPYNMGKRAATVEATRKRILQAALEEYADVGVADASMQSIARRADVSPGTVLYHYPDPNHLADAVMTWRTESMRVPMVDDMDAAAPLPDRVSWLTTEMFRVYANTDIDYHAWLRSGDHPAFQRVSAWYYQRYGELVTAALGSSAARPRAIQVVSALIDPGFRASLRERGLTEQEAVAETAALVVAWLTRSADGDAAAGS